MNHGTRISLQPDTINEALADGASTGFKSA